MDFLAGRQFHASVFVRAEEGQTGARAVTPASLAGLHLAAKWTETPGQAGEGTVVLTGPSDRQMKVSTPTTLAVLRLLRDAWPETRSPGDIRQHLIAEGLAPADLTDEETHAALLPLTIHARFDLHARPHRVGRADAVRPRAFALARHQAGAQDWVTTRAHRAVRLRPDQRWALRLMDGTRDRATLVQVIAESVKAAKSLPEKEEKSQDATNAPMEVAARFLDQLLGFAAGESLLDP